MVLKQETRSLKLTTPLGEDVLLLTKFTGQEGISQLFRFQLEMISDEPAIAMADMVGKNVSFSVMMADGSPRHYNGFVSQFGLGGQHEGRRSYTAEVVPWLWFLSQTNDCRIFQNKSVPEIIDQIFGDLGFKDYEKNLKLSHPQGEYCVQYRETDFEFVTRLMEEEGIFYYFRHEGGKHILVLADHKGAYFDCKENTVDYPSTTAMRSIRDHITSWVHEFSFRTGKVAQTDYNFKTPSTSLMSQTKTTLKVAGTDKFESYDYPGRFIDKSRGGDVAKLRMEEIEAAQNTVRGSSQCKSFTPGGRFNIGMHQSDDEEGKAYVITELNHEAHEPMGYETGAESGLEYVNQFTCIPDEVVARPACRTKKPVVHGVQTAAVVGPPGEEIYPDKYGRVKVQFHWDREGKKDENSSCWVRVSQTHAGPGFGAINIPRIGEEVVISFLEGDPDRPLITGRVYHEETMPPFGLPDSKAICGMKSKTYKGSGYNEYVMDDTAGGELIREHGQYDKDSTIKHDLREHVGNNRARDVAVNETVVVGSNQEITIGSNRTVNVGANQTHNIGSNQKVNIGANHDLVVASNEKMSIGANQELTVGASRTTSVSSADKLSVGATLTVGAGGDIEISSGSKITLTVGGSSITIEDSKITLKSAATVTIEGDAKVETKSAMITSQASGNNEITGATVKIN